MKKYIFYYKILIINTKDERMIDLVQDIALLALGILLLIKGADYFVESGSEIGKTLKISEIILRSNHCLAWH